MGPPLSDVVNSLIRAGLTLLELKEYSYSVDEIFSIMETGADGYRRFKRKEYQIPLMFSVKAVK